MPSSHLGTPPSPTLPTGAVVAIVAEPTRTALLPRIYLLRGWVNRASLDAPGSSEWHDAYGEEELRKRHIRDRHGRLPRGPGRRIGGVCGTGRTAGRDCLGGRPATGRRQVHGGQRSDGGDAHHLGRAHRAR